MTALHISLRPPDALAHPWRACHRHDAGGVRLLTWLDLDERPLHLAQIEAARHGLDPAAVVVPLDLRCRFGHDAAASILYDVGFELCLGSSRPVEVAARSCGVAGGDGRRWRAVDASSGASFSAAALYFHIPE